MKLTHKLCGAVLLATLGMAVAVPGVTKAVDKHEKSGDMDIQFTRDTDDDTDPNIPTFTDGSGDPIGSGSFTRTAEPLIFGVQDVSPLDFGGSAVVNDGGERVFWAKNYTEETGSKPNYVLIKDTRTTKDHSYKLSAKITKPMTTTVDSVSHTLSGATLSYENIRFSSNQSAALTLDTSAVQERVDVTEGDFKTVVNNGDANKGVGQTLIYFGDYTAEETINSSANSVKLTVNGDTEILEGKYAGEVTWVMEETPQVVQP